MQQATTRLADWCPDRMCVPLFDPDLLGAEDRHPGPSIRGKIMSSIRLLIADDRSVTRSGLAALVRECPNLAIAGEACNAEETLRAAIDLAPDVVLLNLRDLPSRQLPELVRRIDGSAVIVLRSAGADVGLRAAVEAHVAGYADLEALEGESAEIIGIVNRGCSVCVVSDKRLSSGAFAGRRTNDFWSQQIGSLTARERELLAWIASGASNRAIATTLHLSESTIKKHGTRIMQKLSVATRLEAAVIYRQATSDSPAQLADLPHGIGELAIEPTSAVVIRS